MLLGSASYHYNSEGLTYLVEELQYRDYGAGVEGAPMITILASFDNLEDAAAECASYACDPDTQIDDWACYYRVIRHRLSGKNRSPLR